MKKIYLFLQKEQESFWTKKKFKLIIRCRDWSFNHQKHLFM